MQAEYVGDEYRAAIELPMDPAQLLRTSSSGALARGEGDVVERPRHQAKGASSKGGAIYEIATEEGEVRGVVARELRPWSTMPPIGEVWDEVGIFLPPGDCDDASADDDPAFPEGAAGAAAAGGPAAW